MTEDDYESIRASIVASHVREGRKVLVVKMSIFTMLYAATRPLEAWAPPHLGGTLVTIGAAFLAQCLIYRGTFDATAHWAINRFPSRRGTTVAWAILGGSVLAITLSIRLLYEGARMLWL